MSWFSLPKNKKRNKIDISVIQSVYGVHVLDIDDLLRFMQSYQISL